MTEKAIGRMQMLSLTKAILTKHEYVIKTSQVIFLFRCENKIRSGVPDTIGFGGTEIHQISQYSHFQIDLSFQHHFSPVLLRSCTSVLVTLIYCNDPMETEI